MEGQFEYSFWQTFFFFFFLHTSLFRGFLLFLNRFQARRKKEKKEIRKYIISSFNAAYKFVVSARNKQTRSYHSGRIRVFVHASILRL